MALPLCAVPAWEVGLAKAGMAGNSLYELIEDARRKNCLGDIEVGLAHTNRLMTRGAIHRAESVPLSDIPSMLSATVRIFNRLA
jgi:hypothetical protein